MHYTFPRCYVLDIGIHLHGVFDSLIFADPLHLFVISFFFFASGYLLCHICLWVMLSHCTGPLACVVHGNFVSWCWFLELEMLLLTFSSSSLLMLLGSPKSLMHSLHEYSSCSDILCSGLMSLSSKFVWGLYNWFLYLILVHYIIL